jgi:hypothetical protein
MKYAIILVGYFSLFSCSQDNCDIVYTDDKYIVTEAEYYTIVELDKTKWVCE